MPSGCRVLLRCCVALTAVLLVVAQGSAPAQNPQQARPRRAGSAHALTPADKLAALGQLTPDEQNTIAVFDRAAASVVFIVNRQNVREPFAQREEEVPVGTGSGFLIDKAGAIVTNAHVVAGASSLLVILSDRTELPATILGVAPEKDVALIQVPDSGTYQPLALGNSDTLIVGQKVLAIGNPYGLDHSLTVGVISALDRETESPTGRIIRGVIQTDAAINPGNSGGPLINSRGEVIGMNTAIVSDSGGSVGIGFAVPVNSIRRLLPQLREYGRSVRPLLGIALADDKFAETMGIDGAIVLQVMPASLAANAGMTGVVRGADGSVLLGDVIYRLEDYEVEENDDLLFALEQFAPGDSVTVYTRFRGETRTYRIRLSTLNR